MTYTAQGMLTLYELACELALGRTTSRALTEACLARIGDAAGEGARTFLKVHAAEALACAEFQDRLRSGGAAPSAYAGIPVSVKDLFDVLGDVTTAGSLLLRTDPPARRDAAIVARLRAAGFIVIGRTNMTEFAYSGLGLNPHYGTPLNPWDRASGRIPGGSSSGAAVSVTDGMAHGAIGTDTGGSCRIPAALCGIVGFKPTAHRVPRTGCYPLSSTLDSIGPLARSVACCATLDAVLADEPPRTLAPIPVAGVRLAVPQSYVLEDIDAVVAAAFERALKVIARAGAHVSELPLNELTQLSQLNSKGGFSAAEVYALHTRLIAEHSAAYDPRVLTRILRGREQSAADYLELQRLRVDFIERVSAHLAPYDAMLLPTVPISAPRMDEVAEDGAYARLNALALRNPAVVNFLDGCAISLPCHEPGTAPVGLMLAAGRDSDHKLLALAAGIEQTLAHRSG
jgi:aspartyl-tRNA(Asn)/glutamyl-tRNA(Gln) amidotransferase subunit A